MQRTFSAESKISRSSSALWRGFGDELAILSPDAGALATLNVVGARIWELADGRTFAELVETLLNEFDVDRNILERDVRTFLSALAVRGLLAPES